jgi:hypothetical protein
VAVSLEPPLTASKVRKQTALRPESTGRLQPESTPPARRVHVNVPVPPSSRLTANERERASDVKTQLDRARVEGAVLRRSLQQLKRDQQLVVEMARSAGIVFDVTTTVKGSATKPRPPTETANRTVPHQHHHDDDTHDDAGASIPDREEWEGVWGWLDYIVLPAPAAADGAGGLKPPV